MRRLLLFSVLAAACKGGLFTDKGNDFPCDFSQPEGVRDAVCAPGDVCGVGNLCRQYRYEGPQFDNGANAPNFGVATLCHPGPLDRPITALTHAKTGEGDRVLAALRSPNADVISLELGQVIVQAPPGLVPYPGNIEQLTAVAMTNAARAQDQVLAAIVRVGQQDVSILYDPGFTMPRTLTMIDSGDRLRNGTDRLAVVRRSVPPGTGAFEVMKGMMEASLDLSADGGPAQRALDVRYLPPTPNNNPAAADDTLILVGDGFLLRRKNGSVVHLGGGAAMPAVLSLVAPRLELRHDVSGTIAAFAAGPKGLTVLSSWRLDRGVTPSAQRLWSDCSPCGKGRISAFAPTFDEGAPAIEVLCSVPVSPGEEAKGGLVLVRVTGSAAADEMQLCTVELVDAPFPLAEVNRVKHGRRAVELDAGDPVFDDAFGAGVALGGVHGQLWVGPSFSGALPLFLDRVPLAFGTLPAPDGGAAVPVAITDRYIAAPRADGMGFQTLDLRNAGAQLPAGAVVSAFIGQAPGWSLASSADVVLICPPTPDAGVGLRFGPRLLDARGAPARGPFFGEAATASDGSLVSFVITADDSLYFSPVPATTTGTADVLEPLTPQLTPAPSSPIRSFTLERSAVGTNGVDRVRAYLVAGRSLFVVTLEGTPPRWKATPIVLQGGEPIEVWMDHPLGGLGRVGFRDGEVFTLPGGFLLVNELPRDAGSKPPQVLDYENLGGWPVAMTSNGLFEAHYDVLPGGKLDNRFPDGGINRAMSWRRLALPDGGEPWRDSSSARLQVTQDTMKSQADSGVSVPLGTTIKVFHLLVYLDHQVLEVGTLLRK